MASYIFSLASTSTTSILLVLVLLSSRVKSDINIPSPFFDNLCDEVICGRGNCSVDLAKPFNFICKCDPGWRRSPVSNSEDDLQFLPCIIPNCSIDYSCMTAPPSSPLIQDNNSIFDPCYWTYCGEGTCNKNHTTYTCDCNSGYTNLMSISKFPCFSDCAIGTDCSEFGVNSPGTMSPPGDCSQSTRFLSRGFHCIGVIIMTVTMALWIHETC